MSNPPSVLKAFALLNKDSSVQDGSDTKDTTNQVLPTAKSRKALDTLINSMPSDLQEISMKTFLQDLFNWDGKNHVNKPLIVAFNNAMNTKGKYPQTVEFTGYMVALAPLLEADQIARMYSIISETETAFAPNLYTINFHSNLKRAFAGLSPQRIEKIALSLWKESHKGRWWNMTAGIENVQENQGQIRAEVILKNLLKYNENRDGVINLENVIWSPENQTNFKTYMSKRLDRNVALLSENFRKDLMEGKAVTPDVAIFLSAIDWLAPNQRPESPINSLLKTLVYIREEDENFKMPKKPNSVTELFPNIEFNATGMKKFDFPFDPTIVKAVEQKEFAEGLDNVKELNLITSKTGLAQNAKYMGNCTLSYQHNMEEGKYALLYMKYGEDEYNIAITLRGESWKAGEINSRFNNGGVSKEVRKTIVEKINNLPKVTPQYKAYIDSFDKEKSAKTYTYML